MKVAVLVTVALLCWPAPGVAAPTATSPAEFTPAPAVTPIPVPEIGARSEEVTADLRLRDARIEAESVTVGAAEAKLAQADGRIDARLLETERMLAAAPSLATLDRMVEPWLALRNDLMPSRDALTRRAVALGDEIDRLDGEIALWRRTRAEAEAAGAPPPLLARTSATLKALDETRARAAAERTRVLLAQDRVTRELTRCDGALASIRDAQQTFVRRLFERDAPPIWRSELRARLAEQPPAWTIALLEADVVLVGEYLRERSGRVVFQLLLFGMLAFLMLQVRRALRQVPAGEDPSFERHAQLFEAPYACALVVTLLLTDWVSPLEARLLRIGLALAALVPVVGVLLRLLPVHLHPVPWTAAAFFLVDQVRLVCSPIPALEYLLFLLESLALVVVLLTMPTALLGRAERLDETPSPWLARLVGPARGLAAVATAALVASALGFTRVARLLEIAILGGTYLALLLLTVIRVCTGLLAYALRVRPLRASHVVQRYRGTIQTRAERILVVLASGFWLMTLLGATSLQGPVVEIGRTVLGASAGYGAIHLSLGDVVVFVATVWLAFWLSSLMRAVLEEDVFSRIALPRGVPSSLSRIVHYLVLLTGFLIALGVLGLDLTRFTILAGAFGVGIGFGLQNIVNNFVSGLILLFERPIQIGDAVQIGQLVGEVRRIGVRSSTIRTYQGAEVIVPNATLIADPVTNWTLSDNMRRLDIPVGAAYGTNPERVLALLRDVANDHPDVVKDPAPQVIFKGFGESSLDFELRCWTGRYQDGVAIRSDVAVRIYRAFTAAGIEIPFPQRDVRLRS